jgi:hypothetical protein
VLHEAVLAKHRTALTGAEGHYGFFAAMIASGAGFRSAARVGRGLVQESYAFCLAIPATLRLILELLVVVEHLLPGSENEVGTAVCALQHLVLKLH